MPVMDGFEATRRIRQQLRLTDLPIIAMTASAMKEDRDRAFEAGMDDYIAKPARIEDIARVFPATLELATAGILLGTITGVPDALSTMSAFI
jgi:CheY-like chemotaxis protein